ncbi:uncharacterized protein LOC26527635 [Drosophila mojavensis]|uniref:MICOS complex subunit MIC13 n=1 Tax=Drosophila mojavensis TaxID=7230 RepID=A0A0Q9XJS8_DROMO|nr:uncharacterized protein LOC26527635 [Drosophila mojavensis]KRG05556.1 uncharacterized protein Dmoj_GI25994 [Drosophila mojavensis]
MALPVANVNLLRRLNIYSVKIENLALRTGIVVAVIMATKRYNIWDSSDETQEVYNSTIRWISPYAKQTCDYLNIQLPSLPPQREKSFLGVYYYNQTVKTLVDLLNMFPTYIYGILERIPSVTNDIASCIREQYHKHQTESEKKKALEKEKNERKIRIDERALVQTIEPHPDVDSKCQTKNHTDHKDTPITSSIKETCPRNKPRDHATTFRKKTCPKTSIGPPCDQQNQKNSNELDKQCKCPKCTIRESTAWSDNKPKCPNRNTTILTEPNEVEKEISKKTES